MKRVKICDDGFVWHVLTEAEAKQAFHECKVFALNDDDTETQITSEKQIETHIRRGGYVGLKVGFVDDKLNN